MTTVLETCRVRPPPRVAAELWVPLGFLDLAWLHFHPIRTLLFYDHQSFSRVQFINTLVPNLKRSLSHTLKHYFPVAGNLLYPLHTDQKKPVLRYRDWDSVSLTIAESSSNFDELTSNHARDTDQFYDFVPPTQIPVGDDQEYRIVPVFALQVTLYPDRGICIGFTSHHYLGDARSIVGFMQAFAAFNKFEGNMELQSLPVFERSVIPDNHGVDTIFWNKLRSIPFDPSSLSCFPIPTNRVKATFTLRQADIYNLKNAASHLDRMSSFVVATSFIWSCLAKSAGKEVTDNDSETFYFSADVRGLINPPAPASFFGNGIFVAVTIIKHKKLVGDEGFLVAAAAIAEKINYIVNKTDKFLEDAKHWVSNMDKIQWERRVSFAVSGSPKFDWHDADFGWGKLRKVEFVSMDEEEYIMSLCKGMECEGGLEVGLSLPRERMKAFQVIFEEGLKFDD